MKAEERANMVRYAISNQQAIVEILIPMLITEALNEPK